MSGQSSRLHVVGLGLALGVTWGLGMLILGLLSTFFAYGHPFVITMSSIYYGYQATFLGAIIGGIWGFIDAFIAGVIIAWLYNCFSGCCKRCD